MSVLRKRRGRVRDRDRDWEGEGEEAKGEEKKGVWRRAWRWARQWMGRQPAWSLRVWLVLAAVRSVQAVSMGSAFAPDEYWQGVEVAHRAVFGFGHLTWEWWPEWRVRSWLFPLLCYCPLLWLLRALNCASRWWVIAAPRLVHGLLAATGDTLSVLCAVHWLAGARGRGRRLRALLGWRVLLCSLSNWFLAYCATRCLANSVEYTLCACALWLCCFPPSSLPHRCLFLLCAALCVAIRPTACLLLGPFALRHLVRLWRDRRHSRQAHSHLRLYLLELTMAALSLLSLLSLLDSLAYHLLTHPGTASEQLSQSTFANATWLPPSPPAAHSSLVLTPLNFLHFNLRLRGAELYGTHSWHWYMSAALPVLLSLWLPCFALGATHSVCSARAAPALAAAAAAAPPPSSSASPSVSRAAIDLAVHLRAHSPSAPDCFPLLASLFALSVLSLSAHKEFRFVLFLLPVWNAYCALGLSLLARKCSAALLSCSLLSLCLLHSAAFLVLSQFHQTASLRVFSFLARDIEHHLTRFASASLSDLRVDILLRCHATPFHAFLHLDDREHPQLRFLDCSPQWDAATASLTRQTTQEQAFFDDPAGFTGRYYQLQGHPCPHYLLIQASHWPLLARTVIDPCRLRTVFDAHDHFWTRRDPDAHWLLMKREMH